ncbi:response regulator [Thalassoroseus pseudoceratinae]|uniref:response regulator n=1 Tax=Thalassoroseus pseudoceratinae TaxID=2713176 RepID=UPI00141EAE37|nr:response regulator [Thalassoroseus pseudoceratinae]
MKDILQFGKQRSALIVDRDRVWCKSLTERLNESGAHATECQCAREALALVMQQRPDIVYLDLLLHDDAGQLSSGGFLLCDQLRRFNPNIPVVVVTEVDLPDARVLADKVGVSAYFIKPIDPRKLIRKTASLFDPSHTRSLNSLSKNSPERVSFRCYCGRRFRMCPSRRREKIACPECGESVVVPA